MKSRIVLTLSALTLSALTFLFCPTVTLALGPGGELEERCPQICDSASCDSDCFWEGSWTKCAIYNGNPANDYDSDGISNASDNCDCIANSDQADCDTDGIGDVCDGQSVKWVKSGPRSDVCYARFYTIGELSQKVRAFSGQLWTDACGTATCVQNIFEGDNFCLINVSPYNCCFELMDRLGQGDSACLMPQYDACGFPKCNF